VKCQAKIENHHARLLTEKVSHIQKKSHRGSFFEATSALIQKKHRNAINKLTISLTMSVKDKFLGV